MKCTFTDCPNDATTAVSRYANEEERTESHVVTERGASQTQLIEMEVCDAHADEAEHQMGYAFRKTLST